MFWYKQFLWLTRSSDGVHPILSERMYNIRPQSRVGNPTNSSTMYWFIVIIISLWGFILELKIVFESICISYVEHTNTTKRGCQPFLQLFLYFFYKIGVPAFLLSSKLSCTISFRYSMWLAGISWSSDILTPPLMYQDSLYRVLCRLSSFFR